MEKTIKNLLLAGIGTLSYGYEKGSSVVDELVKKGELSFEQGKELNEELKKKLDKASRAGSETISDIIAALDLVTVKEFEQYKATVAKEIDSLKQRIAELEVQELQPVEDSELSE